MRDHRSHDSARRGRRGEGAGVSIIVLGLGLLVAVAPHCIASGEGTETDGAPVRWQDDPVWSDGQAEVSVLSATESKYGAPRTFRAIFIVVAEDLRNDTLVKSDTANPPGGLTRVLKMNQVYDIRTGVYAYRQMASVFLRVSDLAPVKETVTSHEWCGNTFIELLNRDGAGTIKAFSYFDGEADTERTIGLAGSTLYDALPLVLRTLPFRDGHVEERRLVPQLLGNRVRPVAVSSASVAVAGPQRITTGLGTSDAWRVEVKHAGGRDLLWFETAPPNRLLRWEQSDGGTYRVEKVRRLAYWKLHDPGDEKVLLDGPEP